jgi:ribonuclease HI
MLIYSDGGCINNGQKNAKAAFSSLINNTVITGYVLPYEYLLCDNELHVNKNVYINPSNNRAELLGIIHVFLYIIKLNDSQIDDNQNNNDNNNVNKDKKNDNGQSGDEYVLYSDSLICVKTINEWYNNREKKNTLHEFKNLDLINIVMLLYRKINALSCLICKHTNSHKKCLPTFTEIEKKIWYGNYLVDKYANELLKDINKFTHYQCMTHTPVQCYQVHLAEDSFPLP